MYRDTSSVDCAPHRQCAEYPFQSAFIMLKRRLKGIVCGTMTGWALTQIGWCWVCGIGSMIDFLHMFAMLPDANDEIWVLAFLPSCIVEGFRQFRIMDECEVAWICPLFSRFSIVIGCVITLWGTVAIEISDYYVWQISVAECWERKLVVLGLVHRMHNYSRHHNRN